MNSVVWRFRILRIVLSMAVTIWLVAITGAVALAHPAPSVLHDYIISLTPQTLTVVSYLRISPELVPEVYRQIDTDSDGQTSKTEWQAWIKTHPSKLQVALDGVSVQLILSAPSSLSQQDLLLSISHPMVVTYTFTAGKALSGKHRIRLTYGDNYLTYDEYYVSVAGDLVNDGQPVEVSRPAYPATYQVVYQMPVAADNQDQKLPAGQIAPAPWSAMTGQPTKPNPQIQGSSVQGTAPQRGSSQGENRQAQAQAQAQAPVPVPVPVPAGSPSANPSIANSSPGPITQLLDTLRDWHGEIWTALGMLVLALVVGALHALTPGHGKAMVAAYLVGSRGRVRDAVLLGGVVTLTHTVGVLVLGLVLLLISNFVVPRALTPMLESASGLLVMTMGAYLLLRRWQEIRTGVADPNRHANPHDHPHPGMHSHHAPDLAEVKVNLSGSTAGASVSALMVASGTSSLPVRRAGGSRFVPYNPNELGLAEIDHGHGHGHSHSGNHRHDHAISPGTKPEGLRALVGLGVSGGIVPCPDALAILLLAASVSQFALGLGLVVSFSLGLAGVLIAIGVTLVKMKNVLERTHGTRISANPLWSRWVPLASAAIVAVVGLLMLLSALNTPWN